MKTQLAQRLLLCGMLLVTATLCAQFKTDHSLPPTTMATTSQSEQNKNTVRSLYEEALNKRNYAFLHQLIAEEFTGIRGLKGAVAIHESVMPLINAFPDINYHIEELTGEGNKVTIRWKWEGTHRASYQQFAPTGKWVTNEGMAIYELKDNKIIAAQVLIDRLGFLQSLGAIPQDLTLLRINSSNTDQVRFIDKFVGPASAKLEFMNRVDINRQFIKKLNGFVEDAAYEGSDENGNFTLVTIAVWQNEEVLKKAKEAVQAEYKREGFNPAELMERLHITMDRGVYQQVQCKP